MMVEEPDSENSLFSDPMKIRTPSARSARPKQIDHAALGLEIVEQQPDALEILQRMQIFQQIGVTAHDQLAVFAFAAGPAREPGRDHLLRQLIEFGAVLRQRGFEFEPRFGQRSARESAH